MSADRLLLGLNIAEIPDSLVSYTIDPIADLDEQAAGSKAAGGMLIKKR